MIFYAHAATAAGAGHRRDDFGWAAAGRDDAGGADATVRRGVDWAAEVEFLLEEC